MPFAIITSGTIIIGNELLYYGGNIKEDG